MSGRPAESGPHGVHAAREGAADGDDVPAAVRVAAVQAFALRDREARVLDLLTDTLVDDPSTGGPRRLRFLDVEQGADVTVLVHELPEPDLTTLDIAVGPAPTRVAGVQSAEGSAVLHEISPGRWLAGPIQHGLMSILIAGTGRRLRTAWVRV